MNIKANVAVAVLGCVAVMMSTVPGFASQKAPVHPHGTGATAMPAHAMEARCAAMSAAQQKMKDEMSVADQRLDGLIATMNRSSPADRPIATSAVVTEMATGGRKMRDAKAQMEQEMMGHMMEHMQAGKDSMANCPMMKAMHDMKPMHDMKH